MAGPNDKAFRSMLRSSTIKKACDQNAVSNHERDIKTMSELAGDMARGMKISKRASRKKRVIGTKEEQHEARVHTPTAVAGPAALKALRTTEILEIILSHVPAFDLIAATNVNDFFYNCAVNSPIIQQTMLLRSGVHSPPQCYRIHRSWTGSSGEQVRRTTLGLTPSVGMSNDDTSQWAEPCTAVRLCPALRQVDHYVARENIVTPTDDLRNLRINGNEMLLFTATPIEIGRLDMFASDPPVTGASIFLCYKHAGTSFAVYIHYANAHGSQLTFNSIFEGAWSATNGSIALVEGADVSGACMKSLSDTTLAAVTSEYIELHGGSFALDLKSSWIKLNAIVPTEAEWDTMQQILAEEEEKKKKKMDPGHHAAWMAKLLGNR